MNQDDLLLKLKAHGDAFLTQLGVEPILATTSSKKRKRRAKKEESDEKSTTYSTCKKTPTSIAEKSQIKDEPQVVVFNDTVTRQESSAEDYKSFMSSKIKTPQNEIKSKKEQKEEEEDRKKDADLQELLKTTRLLEDYNAETLVGKDRLKHLRKRTNELGIQEKKQQHPRTIAMGLLNRQEERDKKRVENAKEIGLYHSTTKHLYETTMQKTKKAKEVKYRRDRGIGSGVGKFKRGILKLSDGDLARLQNSGSKTKRRR